MSPSNHRAGGRQRGTQTQPDPACQPAEEVLVWEAQALLKSLQGAPRARAILIRQALVRALIVLALTLCPVYHWTSQ